MQHPALFLLAIETSNDYLTVKKKTSGDAGNT